MYRMNTTVAAVWLVVALLCPGCKKPPHPPQISKAGIESPPSFRERVGATEQLSETFQVVLLSYDDFLAMPRQLTAKPSTRAEAARIASRTTHPAALGVFGQVQDGPYQGEIFVVARDFRPSSGVGEFEASDFAVVAMQAGWAGPHVIAPLLGLTQAITEMDCDPYRRGCHPLFESDSSPHTLASPDEGGAGLPSPTIVNAESAINVQNATGYSPELWLVHDRDSKVASPPNRFVCFGAVESPGGCLKKISIRETVVSKAPYQRALAPDFALIGEEDYKRLVDSGAVQALDAASIQTKVVAAATLANAPESIGIFARLEGTRVDGPVVVARDLRRTEAGLEATSFYFPTVRARAETT